MGTQQIKPDFLKPIKNNIPTNLKERPQWVTWVAVYKPDKKKPWDKVPYNAKSGKTASSTTPDTWSNFNIAYQKCINSNGNCDGIGFV